MNIGKNSCMQSVNKLAKIRFKGFNTSLERKQIGEITTSFSGGTPKSSNKSYYEGDIPFIRSGEVKSKQTELFISEDALKDSSAKMVEKGDILYALYGATSGEVAISQINGAINQAILAIKPKPGYSSEFMMNYLKKEKDNILEKYLQGGQGNLSAAIVKSIELSLPNLAEQSAISSLFLTLDDLLASYKDNLANYQSLKATMLSKMFPKAGQKVPEIRLDGFEGEWKKDTFEPYLTESRISGDTGLTAKKITVKLWGKGVIEKEEKYAGSSNTQYFIRKAGQFIYSKLDFQNQAFGIIPNELDGYQSTLDLPTFDIQNIDPKFLLEYVMRREFYEYQGLIANGSRKAKRIHPEDFLVMPVSIPSLEEQQAIGSFFSNLDNLINSHQEKISQLETLKKKLLKDMFI